ncbi:MAG: hypothetical protein M1827_007212 [Pycnora praestabilis]|nr:MAG: hypothetical protein M1827_007212 [Pycnora praestabilis]
MAAPTSVTAAGSPQLISGTMWGGLALSLFFFIFRIYVRLQSFRTVYADDLLVLAAWLMYLASAIIWQWDLGPLYAQLTSYTGQGPPPPEFLATLVRFLHTEVSLIFLFYTSLWLVKLSVLIFFRRLGQGTRGFKKWWWCVLGFTVISWGVVIGVIDYGCLLGSVKHITGECAAGAETFQYWTLRISCIFDVLTDVTIITLPYLMLRKARISWTQKLALMGIFSLTVIVMIFAIVRVAIVTSTSAQGNISWLDMWSNIEMAVCM